MTPSAPTDGDVLKTGAAFCTTHWSLVLTAAQGDNSPSAREALARLCSIYWYPLYAFCRRQGRQPHDAEDLTQGFFSRLLEKNRLGAVQPENGRFRDFLLACFKNFLSNEWDRTRALRRGGGCRILSLNAEEAEQRYALEPSDDLTPEVLFERKWAWAVLNQTMNELRRDYVTEGKGDQFDQLQGFLPGGLGTVSRADLAADRGVTVGAIDVAVHRLRQRFGARLREQIASTVASEADVKEEIRHLISILGGCT